MPKPSLRDRTRAVWAKTWAKHKDRVKAYQKKYMKRHYEKVIAPRIRGEKPTPPKAEVLFEGRIDALKLACVICDTSFLVEKSRSNYRPKLCPVCQASSMAMQKEAYEDRLKKKARA